MNKYADEMQGLRKRASGDKLMRTLDALEILRDLPDESGKKPRVRLPYSSDPRSFEEPWK
jgi:hypothetical protein